MSTTTTATYALSKFGDGDTGWGGAADANMDTLDTEVSRPRIVFATPAVAATTTCDLSAARVFVFTVSQATTLAFSNVPTSTWAVRIRLLITNGSSFALTFPASVTWLAGIKPTFKASGVDEVEMLTKDGGTTWYATLRNLRPGPLFQAQGLSTGSVSDVSLTTFSLPAGTLATNGQAIRIAIGGQATGTGGATPVVKFGATTVFSAVLGNVAWQLTILVTRTGATAQLASGSALQDNAAVRVIRTAPAETLANAITIDFRGSVGSGTFFYDTITVELLAVA